MKQVDKLVIGSFLGPYVMSFFVAEFVLVMQFLWRYIDDIIGKGISFSVLLEMIFYYAMTIIPLAVPVTVLIASVMVFGNMSERYELSSLKSAGVSLIRVMKGGIIIAILTGGFSLFSSNYLKPKANFKFAQRLYSIRKQKPTLSIEEGIFNKDFKNYIIRVGKKHPDGRTIEDILIYDQTGSNPEEISVIMAKKGEMFTTEDGNFFVMNLYEGEQFRDLRKKVLTSKEKREGKKEPSKYPFLRTKFEVWGKSFDMSQFEFDDKNPSLDRNKKDLMNTAQILYSIDSLNRKVVETTQENGYRFDHMFDTLMVEKTLANQLKESKYDKYRRTTVNPNSKETVGSVAKESSSIKAGTSGNNSNLGGNKTKVAQKKSLLKKVREPVRRTKKREVIAQDPKIDIDTVSSIAYTFDFKTRNKLIAGAISTAKASRDRVKSIEVKNKNYEHTKNRYITKLNQQYSWALICIIFLFIGAPLGSIIRKGGYGYPLLVAIIFFMIFIILQIMGDKLNRSDQMNSYLAAWLPCLVLLPVAVFLTHKALNDSKIFNITYYTNKIFGRFHKND